MLSHLRFHRRGTSNPTSPIPDQHQQQPVSPLSNSESPLAPASASPLDGMPASATSSTAPTLPPITRVTSSDSDSRHERDQRQNASGLMPENRPHQSQRPSYTGAVGFIGGMALQNYRRGVEAQQKASRTDTGSDRADGSKSLVIHPEDPAARLRPGYLEPTPDVPRSGQFKQIASFSTPTDLQASNASNLGRRPAGARLPQEAPFSLSSPSSSVAPEPHKGKKGLPFLKNPMSTLLMRRRNNQNAPDLRPLPLSTKDEEPAYDPRIRGTRVHDFSAPRKPRHVYAGNPASSRSVSDVQLTSAMENQPAALNDSGEPPIQARRSAPQSVKTTSRSQSSVDANDVSIEKSDSKTSVSAKPTTSTTNNAPIATLQQLHTDGNSGLPRSSSKASVLERAEMSPKASSSIRTTRSRNISLSDMSMSAIPKHMKSTSSRFSFDMVGAAKQEKLLEERHRQRELERKTNDNDGFRDSRLDDFDDDAFDYDAMMDDDGFEERIPGINADFEEEVPESYDLDVDLDPNNDQENFAGFDFQRSDPTSALGSPYSNGMLITPRDADGNVIGFAMTKDTPDTSAFPSSPLPAPSEDAVSEHKVSGLGIRDASASLASKIPQNTKEDDLYFDDGMIRFENEFAEDLAASPDATNQPFDESIFDNNDTDQFGRPVPGAFQQAQSLRRADQQSSTKRQSDITSRLSAHSAFSRSTAHTSLSVDGQAEEETGECDVMKKSDMDTESENKIPPPESDGAKSVAAYQAALAAAAHRAAASGKFQRSSSPSSIPIQSDDESIPEITQDNIYGGYDDEEDDFDFDDDAIIAEANASALANDSDGWYGQEFGFYSAPPGLHHTAHNGASSTLKEYEYANGGFFGPEGMDALNRSTSGRMISREPNLTPITERSEYSNRNSFMSLGYAPLSTSTPIVQSPGLAQLAMMADCGDDQMTLSALLRLRSRAWGGSQASLASSREGSPRSDRGDLSSSPWMSTSSGQAGQANHGHGRMPCTFSAVGYDSDAASASGSPTMTMANMNFDHWPGAAIPEEDALEVSFGGQPTSAAAYDDPLVLGSNGLISQGTNQAPMCLRSLADVNNQADEHILNEPTRSPVKGHRHKGSADSVSYMKEEDSGETRWVIERRRTGGTGEVEVLEREVIEGGRI